MSEYAFLLLLPLAAGDLFDEFAECYLLPEFLGLTSVNIVLKGKYL